MAVYYNLHNLVKIKIEEGGRGLPIGYESFFRNFRSQKKLENVDYEIKEFPNFKLPQNHFDIEGRFIGFKNGIYLPKERYALEWDGDKIIEYTNYAHKATNALLQALLTRQNVSLIHAAGIEINGKGLIFPALGGVGKTTLVAFMRHKKGFKFFGDDYVLVSNGGVMYSYPTDFSVYRHHLANFPELKNSKYSGYLWRRKTFAFYYLLKKAIRKVITHLHPPFLDKITSAWDANYVKVPRDRLIAKEKFGDKTQIGGVVFLEKHNDSEVKLEKSDPKDIARLASSVLTLELFPSFRYLLLLSLTSNLDCNQIVKDQHRILEQCFSDIKCYRLYIPAILTAPKIQDELTNIVKNIKL